jgi:hypothetical protein
MDEFLQTWPTEEELMEASNDEKTRLSKKKKKLLVPRGTSDYQVLNPPYPIACFSFFHCVSHLCSVIEATMLHV